jgi:hypothetical protein
VPLFSSAFLSFPTGPAPWALCTADLDADGRADLVVATTGNDSVSVLMGSGDGAFAARRSFAAGSIPAAVASADLDGDGHLDLVVADGGSGKISVLHGDGRGSFKKRTQYDSVSTRMGLRSRTSMPTGGSIWRW